MQSVLVIGAGGVSHVTVHKMASLSKVFTNIILASRTIDKCLKIKKSVKTKYNTDINLGIKISCKWMTMISIIAV